MADLHDLAPAYAMDALDASEREEFEAHLAECEACQAEVEALRSATVVLAEESAAVPPASLRASVLAAVETTEQQAVVVDMPTAATHDDHRYGRSRGPRHRRLRVAVRDRIGFRDRRHPGGA